LELDGKPWSARADRGFFAAAVKEVGTNGNSRLTMNTEARLNRTITLADGRRTGFAEVGDPSGAPVVYCHGFPASRLESQLVAPAALRKKARIIAPDRPGYGLSDWKAERSLVTWADDVAELADKLELDKFSVLGVSGGGPYALALAHRIPERIESVAVVCGLGPIHRAGVLNSMHWPARIGFGTARSLPRLNRLIYGGLVGQVMRHRPEAALALLTVGMPDSDRRTLAQPEIRSVLCEALREGLRQGTRGALLDMALYVREWQFDPAEIVPPVAFWHGDADATVPLLHTRLLAEAMPRAAVHVLPGEGHFSLPFDHADEILETLLNQINCREMPEGRA
jgi:pimeloyl-ACP methyl ester carboxylesterase